MTPLKSADGTSTKVLKQDTRGRVRTPVERRESLLDEFEHSGVSGAEFARLAGIKYATFMGWRHQRKRRATEGGGRDEGGSTAAPATRRRPVRLFEAFAEVAGSGGHGSGLQIDLGGGVRMQLDSLRQVPLAAELLRLLQAGGLRGC
jgi:hypothetical protein